MRRTRSKAVQLDDSRPSDVPIDATKKVSVAGRARGNKSKTAVAKVAKAPSAGKAKQPAKPRAASAKRGKRTQNITSEEQETSSLTTIEEPSCDINESEDVDEEMAEPSIPSSSPSQPETPMTAKRVLPARINRGQNGRAVQAEKFEEFTTPTRTTLARVDPAMLVKLAERNESGTLMKTARDIRASKFATQENAGETTHSNPFSFSDYTTKGPTSKPPHIQSCSKVHSPDAVVPKQVADDSEAGATNQDTPVEGSDILGVISDFAKTKDRKRYAFENWELVTDEERDYWLAELHATKSKVADSKQEDRPMKRVMSGPAVATERPMKRVMSGPAVLSEKREGVSNSTAILVDDVSGEDLVDDIFLVSEPVPVRKAQGKKVKAPIPATLGSESLKRPGDHLDERGLLSLPGLSDAHGDAVKQREKQDLCFSAMAYEEPVLIAQGPRNLESDTPPVKVEFEPTELRRVPAHIKAETKEGRVSTNDLSAQLRGVYEGARIHLIASICLNHSFPNKPRQDTLIKQILLQVARQRKVGSCEDDYLEISNNTDLRKLLDPVPARFRNDVKNAARKVTDNVFMLDGRDLHLLDPVAQVTGVCDPRIKDRVERLLAHQNNYLHGPVDELGRDYYSHEAVSKLIIGFFYRDEKSISNIFYKEFPAFRSVPRAMHALACTAIFHCIEECESGVRKMLQFSRDSSRTQDKSYLKFYDMTMSTLRLVEEDPKFIIQRGRFKSNLSDWVKTARMPLMSVDENEREVPQEAFDLS